jgi:hypothetical protein
LPAFILSINNQLLLQHYTTKPGALKAMFWMLTNEDEAGI